MEWHQPLAARMSSSHTLASHEQSATLLPPWWLSSSDLIWGLAGEVVASIWGAQRMALSLSLSFFVLSLSVSIHLSIYLSIYLSISLSLSPFLSLSLSTSSSQPISRPVSLLISLSIDSLFKLSGSQITNLSTQYLSVRCVILGLLLVNKNCFFFLGLWAPKLPKVTLNCRKVPEYAWYCLKLPESSEKRPSRLPENCLKLP